MKKHVKQKKGRRSVTSEVSGLTVVTNLDFDISSEPSYDPHGYLGRTSGDYNIQEKIRFQSIAENCNCEVLDDNIDVHESYEGHNDLREIDYGVELKPQSLRIDFTPIPGVDDDPERLDKVTTFWNYLWSCQQYKRLMVFPNAKDAGPSEGTKSDTGIPEPEVDGIQWIKKPATGYKLQTMAKLPGTKYCPHKEIPDDYLINDENMKFGEKIEKLAPITKPSSSDIKSCYCKKKTDTYKLCQVMDDFDRKHPKSMEPPGHPPPLSYAFLQRVHSTVALPSSKRKDVIGCDCPKLQFKYCHCCGRESVADLRSLQQN